jgi:hypothetical protein
MINSRTRFSVLFPIVAFVLAACTWITPPALTVNESESDNPAAITDHPDPPADCPVTLPNGRTPVDESPSPFQHHGNDSLITALWPNGVVVIEPSMERADGSLAMKWPWWRTTPGQLSITGRRLDANAPRVQSQIPDGYGETGFQASAIFFPAEGCWELTGRVSDASLTFATWVERR